LRVRTGMTSKGTTGIQHLSCKIPYQPDRRRTRVLTRVPTKTLMLPRTTTQHHLTTPTTPTTTVTATTRSQQVGKCTCTLSRLHKATITLSRPHKATITLSRRHKATISVALRTSNTRLLPRICTPVKVATDTMVVKVAMDTTVVKLMVKEATHTMLAFPIFHRLPSAIHSSITTIKASRRLLQ
jgi:hypothetical protein